MLQAIEAIRSKACKMIHKAAKQFNVPSSTLDHHLNGCVKRNQAHEQAQNLTHAEEAELEQ
jgi:hypothetical protein